MKSITRYLLPRVPLHTLEEQKKRGATGTNRGGTNREKKKREELKIEKDRIPLVSARNTRKETNKKDGKFIKRNLPEPDGTSLVSEFNLLSTRLSSQRAYTRECV